MLPLPYNTSASSTQTPVPRTGQLRKGQSGTYMPQDFAHSSLGDLPYVSRAGWTRTGAHARTRDVRLLAMLSAWGLDSYPGALRNSLLSRHPVQKPNTSRAAMARRKRSGFVAFYGY